jgi:hypothetical protein
MTTPDGPNAFGWMATPKAWRALGDAFSAAAARDLVGETLAALYHGLDESTGDGIVRGWELTSGTAESAATFKALACEGASLLGYLPRTEGWTDWLASLCREPLLVEKVDRKGFTRGGCNVRLAHATSSDYCGLLASEAALPPLAPLSLRWERMSVRFLRRASWLRAILAHLRLSPRALQETFAGPHHKTTERILTGHPVTDSTLERLARALTTAGHPTTVSDIPED